MILNIDKKEVEILGDPHLGRSFVHGVPLHRRGDRELMVWKQFAKSIAETKADVHVCMGDLFDKAIVSYDIIVKTALSYIKAAKANRKTSYVILKGNHDWIRDLERVSAFDLFCLIIEGQAENIIPVSEYDELNGLAFFAWHPTITASDMVTNAKGTVAFGHWDIESYGGDDLNLIPTKALKSAGYQSAFTGHIHKRQSFERDDLSVQVVGSMQPYAHGEESDTDLYITLPKEDLDDTLTNKCVRVILQPGELLDEEIDCLQLTIKKILDEDDSSPSVSLGDFDMEALFRKAFEDVKPEITEALLSLFNTRRLADGV